MLGRPGSHYSPVAAWTETQTQNPFQLNEPFGPPWVRHCARTWKLVDVLPSGTVTGPAVVTVTDFVIVLMVDVGVFDGYLVTVAVIGYVRFSVAGEALATTSKPPLGAVLVSVTVQVMDWLGVSAAGHVTDLMAGLEF